MDAAISLAIARVSSELLSHRYGELPERDVSLTLGRF